MNFLWEGTEEHKKHRIKILMEDFRFIIQSKFSEKLIIKNN